MKLPSARKGNDSRRYTMRARASAVRERRERVLEAAYELLMTSSWEDVSLERVAQRAAVGFKTVVRRFGSKDALLIACIRWRAPRESAARAVDPGDVEGAARTLAERYEQMGHIVSRYLPLEDRIPAVAEMLSIAR